MRRPILFVLSWERPIYLWATLDALFRNTQRDLEVILIDNNSQDPLVHHVIDAFSKRGMFSDVLRCSENRPDRMNIVIKDYIDRIGDFFFFCENDVVVPENICWATEYEKIYQDIPGVAMIGSFCDKEDFIDERNIRDLEPELDARLVEFYAKSDSPERTITIEPGMRVWPKETPNPPGRLTLLSAEAILKTGFHPDGILAKKINDVGMSALVCTTFRHRHLSLLNWYDVSDKQYANARKKFFRGMLSKRDLAHIAFNKVFRMTKR